MRRVAIVPKRLFEEVLQMTMTETKVPTNRISRSGTLPGHIHNPDFDSKGSLRTFDPQVYLSNAVNYDDKYMPDDVTRDHAKRMHYAAARMHKARTKSDLAHWQSNYHGLRDRIVLGNRKLIYRAVRRRMELSNRTDDMIGDCHIVLIQVVAAFNPWMGIRFSTYAYTCLLRALSRISQRSSTDRLTRALSFGALADGEPSGPFTAEPCVGAQYRLDDYLRDDHPLLSEREKVIISRRFCIGDGAGEQTLEFVGKAMGLSKERVRQVQASALIKLRKALSPVS